MTFNERLADILARMREAKLEAVVALHDGAHFIEKPNPVTVITGFKSLGPVAAILRSDGTTTLDCHAGLGCGARRRTMPAGARDRRRGHCRRAHRRAQQRRAQESPASPACGSCLRSSRSASPPRCPRRASADKLVFDAARTKTDDEIANAREATRIAELGYRHLLEIAKPGMSEDELAVELKWFMKTLGADDNFLLLCAGPHNRAVQPSTGRKFQKGDIILAEITPSVRGQLAQICRTVVVGDASAELADKYALVVHAMDQGIAAAQPGVPMAEVCRAINTVLEAKGYAEFCHPPHIRRRGHGLGFASVRPGDVALDNETVLEPDMVFMIHPNQYLPETGYLLCGEPVLLTSLVRSRSRRRRPRWRRWRLMMQSARRRCVSPPPCGEGLGVGAPCLAPPPSRPSPQGEGSESVLPTGAYVHAASYLADRPVRLGRKPRAEGGVRPAHRRAVGGLPQCLAGDRVRQRRPPCRARLSHEFRAEARARHRAADARRQAQAPVRRRAKYGWRDEAPHLHRRHGAAQRAGEAHRRMAIAAADRRRRHVNRRAQDDRRGHERLGAGCDGARPKP